MRNKMLKEIRSLLAKDFRLEWRNQDRLAGVLLYLFTTILVLYYTLVKIEKFLWVGVFWILFTFLSISALNSSFSKELKSRHWYYYTLVHPISIFLAKLIFNFISLVMLSLLSIFMMNIFFTLPKIDWYFFVIILIFSSLGISTVFTFVSLISAKASDQGALMAVLATPLIFPIIMSGSRLMLNAFGILADSNKSADFLAILSINAISLGIAFVLFPILWRD